ncbi:MAG: LytTR family DNA-binding domain-containing protein [Bacteroidota bacterium]|nr:LytTR family DNA-binding domain-containing protein [Bacteroidota bacterium]
MNCILVDDDPDCIRVLSGILKTYCPQIKIAGTANSIAETVTLINSASPDIVFLDIEIHNELGFDLFQYFSSPRFEVIFTTAHEKYALKAIKSSCYDFLLKPVNILEVVNVVSKLEKERQQRSEKNIDVLLDNLKSKDNTLKKIAIPCVEGYSFINVDEIISLEADGKYTKITSKGLKSTSIKNIGEFEELLNSDYFFRIHKSWIINLNYVKKYLKNDNQVLLSNDTIADVSFRKKDAFLKLFGKA